MSTMNLFSVLLHSSLLVASVTAFSTRSLVRPNGIRTSGSPIFSSKANMIDTARCTFTPIFDFSDIGSNATSNFERIDDAIMGGISLSSIRQNPHEEFARWSGICRLDGGGFCGTRTLPFKSAFKLGDADGFYVLCRLTSDDEPDRRVWKLTTRAAPSRSEQLYQAMFELPASTGEDEWNLIKVKFSDFVEVRGPRVVEGGPKLNATDIYQIGMALSKFKISSTGEQIENFRPGYFELQVKEIGAFRIGNGALALEFPGTLEKKEAEKAKPLPLKVLGPIAKVFFSEKRRRRASAMRILKKRGYSTLRAMIFGVKARARASGWQAAIVHTIIRMGKEMLLRSFAFTLQLLLVYPVQLIRKLMGLFSKPKSEAPKQ